MTTIEERVSRIEGAYEHMATKADIQEVKTDVQEVKSEIQKMKFDLTIQLGGLIIAATAITIAVLRFFS